MQIFQTKFYMQLVVLLVTSMLSFAIYAENELPFDCIGSIDEIRTANNLIIDDARFVVADSATLRNEAELTITFSDLEIGDYVGCNYTDSGNTKLITELNILDDTFDIDDY